jgi:hypothetical protein
VFDQKIGDEDLYRIPGAARATLTPLSNGGALPPLEASGEPVAVSEQSPDTWQLVTRASEPSVLRLRLTNAPGWHATIDGHPLALTPFGGIMLQARVPAGTHRVELGYWPKTLTIGIGLAIAAALGLGTAVVVDRRRRIRHSPDDPGTTSAGEPPADRPLESLRELVLEGVRPTG